MPNQPTSIPSYFYLPLTNNNEPSDGPHPITLEDVGRLPDLSHEIRAVLATFGKRAEVISYGNGFRIIINSDPAPDLLPEEDIQELLERTAKELKANVQGGNFLPHANALTSSRMVRILRAVSLHQDQESPKPTFTNKTGTYPIPQLKTTDFAEPGRENQKSRTGIFQILGYQYSGRLGHLISLTKDKIQVVVGEEIRQILTSIPISAIKDGLWYEGTILLNVDNQWTTCPDGKIQVQDVIL